MLWSVKFPLMALAQVVNAMMSTVHQFKEFVMSKLHEMVLVGVALLSVPGRTDSIQFG